MALRRNHKMYFITTVTIFICVGIFLLASRVLVDARILRPNWFIDGFINPSEWIAKWLRNPTCNVPCWENITLGETNRDQAKSLLSSNPDITSIEESDVIPYGQVLNINLDNDVYPDDATILFDEKNIAQEIEFSTFGNNLYLNDTILAFGSPKEVLFRNQEYEYVTVDLLYPELGMIIELFLRNLNLEGEIPKVRIEKYAEVRHIYLNTPGLKYFFDTSGIVDPGFSYEWQGYTTYP